jgi:tetratricopeptide (TPR) repeat protein
MKNVLIACAFLTLLSAKARKEFNYFKYRSELNKADYEFEKNRNYTKALIHYKAAFKIGNENVPGAFEYQNASICCLCVGDTQLAIKYVRNAISKGHTQLENQTWFKNRFSEKHWHKIVFDYEKQKNKYWSSQNNIETRIEIATMEKSDNYMRTELIRVLEKKSFDSLLKVFDSLNVARYIELLRMGKADPISFLNYHLYDGNEKYFPYIDSLSRKAIYTGKVNPSGYCQWYDRQRIYVRGLKTQLYGEFNEMGRTEFIEIEDIQNVDKRRAEIGLCTLKEYADRRGMILPKNYPLPK